MTYQEAAEILQDMGRHHTLNVVKEALKVGIEACETLANIDEKIEAIRGGRQ